MPIERGRRTNHARASAPTFPPDDEREPRPSHADASHIARRRVPSAPAHEVDLDEVELLDEAPRSGSASLPRLSPPPPLTPPPPRRTSVSIVSAPPLSAAPSAAAPLPSFADVPPAAPLPSAFASEPPPSHAPFDVPITIAPLRPRSRVVTALACAGIALGIGAAAGLVFRPRLAQIVPPPAAHPAAAEQASGPAPVSASPAAAGTASPKSEVRVVEVTTLPRATFGTVVGAAGHRLWIDGNLAASWQAPVSCGTHAVQVGSAGTVRTVDVPCGELITVQP